MADRGILFSAPMVRALLDGRKTQTRRILTPQPLKWEARVIDITEPFFCDDEQAWGQIETTWHYPADMPMGEPLREDWLPLRLPYAVGDRLWVRETWRVGYGHDWYREELGRPPKPSEYDPVKTPIEYLADGTRELGGSTHPSIFMPRWASRLTLIVTDVRVQRLQDISEADCDAECFAGDFPGKALPDLFPGPAANWGHLSIPECYGHLWNSLHDEPGERWEDNPWIVAVSFDVVKANIDQVRP